MNSIKGLTSTIIFEAESANYGESVGNVASLKKMARGKGEQYTYISRQALTYNMVEQLSEPLADVVLEGSGEKGVIQYSKDCTIRDYPELDFFGYLKTQKESSGLKRSAKVRVSNAVSLESYKGDLDFLTNKGLADRIGSNMNIAQAEIHHSLYKYSVVIDLDQIGFDDADKENIIEIDNIEKSRRVQKLLDTISMLYRDIRGRREDLKPIFVIGGVYDIKNPFFHNIVSVKDNKVDVNQIKEGIFDAIKDNTIVGFSNGKFENSEDIAIKLDAKSVPEFFAKIKEQVKAYYEGN
ncbi:type I-B CRISPR-associated protein Cas7/Cst2/DevR [Peptostreptococcus canis]|uniref:Type I-B CRISPR-associated protein Cas7/Cst2/DevR n=1 Tax=Peptostreptococcus canis TaxID=1159213 RepID=A0ABR6TLL6_9FIRM|nr:type I-B CRISPR-associated protein Cas7/Cst2/DevR [Peptostreptococcus canis]MBC2576299.1 type I-B CRISPR-associated protein Cas7/Cst2/DevR [Peptostreptococcus canis]MBP1998497.1 CRISPR-associated protein Cst2 [Peptostreptococcus canis]